MKTQKRKSEVSSRTRLRSELLPLYSACMKNANQLTQEAQLLLDHGHHARAFCLAFTAYEEIGKAQVVADFINDCVSTEEFDAAFRSHTLKSAYVGRHVSISRHGRDATLVYDEATSRDLIATRMDSLYVGRHSNGQPRPPQDTVDSDCAQKMIEAAVEEIHSIEHAEWLNQRIGSKGLFK